MDKFRSRAKPEEKSLEPRDGGDLHCDLKMVVVFNDLLDRILLNNPTGRLLKAKDYTWIVAVERE